MTVQSVRVKERENRANTDTCVCNLRETTNVTVLNRQNNNYWRHLSIAEQEGTWELQKDSRADNRIL